MSAELSVCLSFQQLRQHQVSICSVRSVRTCISLLEMPTAIPEAGSLVFLQMMKLILEGLSYFPSHAGMGNATGSLAPPFVPFLLHQPVSDSLFPNKSFIYLVILSRNPNQVPTINCEGLFQALCHSKDMQITIFSLED